jgi:hypothetical protein
MDHTPNNTQNNAHLAAQLQALAALLAGDWEAF